MGIFIQINFNSGLGDFFSYFCEVYFFSKKMKKKGFKINLIINTKNEIDFQNLFEKKYYKYFDTFKIQKFPIKKSNFFNFDVYGLKENESGLHSWELFGPYGINQEFFYHHFNLGRKDFPINYDELTDFPKLNRDVIKEFDFFIQKNLKEKFSVIHIRESDSFTELINFKLKNCGIDNINYLLSEDKLKKIDEIVKINDSVFLCSNNVYVKKILKKKYKSIILLEDDVEVVLEKNYSNKTYWTQCILEFYIMSRATKIYSFTNYEWVSNFLIYGLLSKRTSCKST